MIYELTDLIPVCHMKNCDSRLGLEELSLPWPPSIDNLSIDEIDGLLDQLEEAMGLNQDNDHSVHVQHKIFTLCWEAIKLCDRNTSWKYWNKIKDSVSSSAFHVLISHQQLLFVNIHWNECFDVRECVNFLIDCTILVTID